MQKGKIIEQGNHEALLRDYPEGLYAKFVKEQENSEATGTPDSKLSPIAEVEEEEDGGKLHPASSLLERQNKQKEKESEKIEKEKQEQHDKADEAKEKELTALKEKITKEGHMGRVFGISDPKWLIFVAVIFSICLGSTQPLLGIYIGKMLFVLQPPEPIT